MQPMNNDHPPTLKFDTLTWQAFFYVTTFLVTLNFANAALVLKSNLSLFDYLDLAISGTATVGLYGLAFQKRIGRIVFWRYFFYIVAIETLIVTLIFPLLSIPLYGQASQFSAWYVIGSVFFTAVIYGNYIYAYKQPRIWFTR